MFQKKINKVLNLNVNQILSNPNQPRTTFAQQDILELAQSIKEFGLLQPITVRKVRAGFELIAGERRLRACKMIGIEHIPAIVMEMDNSKSSTYALIENLQRKDLSYLEEAEGYYNLITNFGLTQDEIAKKIGKSQAAIANKLRVLKLSDAVKKNLISASLTERHARALLKLNTDELQLYAIAGICGRGLNVKQTEEYVEEILQAEEMAQELDAAAQADNIRHYDFIPDCPHDVGAAISRPNFEGQHASLTPNPYTLTPDSAKGAIHDVRVFAQTIARAVDMLNRGGIKAETDQNQTDSFVEYKIKIAI
ncbi:MAG: ParB/RepB/Spo0J family partition protein [Oscillospiraceae bacterium]|nr:ParB/RepB/Spo0J family partition protein [Oscillospiraceae bacterium]